MASIAVLTCPVCGAPLAPEDKRCSYCGSHVVITSDHGYINPASLNRQVIDQKIGQFRMTLRHDSKDAMAHYGLGLAYFNLQLWEEAADELKTAARLMPENAHIQFQYAVVLIDLAQHGNKKMWAVAQERLDRVLRLKPDYVDALLLKGDLANQTGDITGACSYWTAAYSADPIKSKAQYLAGLILDAEHELTGDKVENAVDTYRQIARLDEDIARDQLKLFLNNHSVLVPPRTMTKPGKRRTSQIRRGLKSVGVALVTLVLWMFILIWPINWFISAGKQSGAIEAVALILALAYFAGWLVMPLLAFRSAWRHMPVSNEPSIPAQYVYRRDLLNGQGSTDDMLIVASIVASKLSHNARTASVRPSQDRADTSIAGLKSDEAHFTVPTRT